MIPFRGIMAITKCVIHTGFEPVTSSLSRKRSKPTELMNRMCCDPDATRTHDRLLRRQMLYPAELPDHHGAAIAASDFFVMQS